MLLLELIIGPAIGPVLLMEFAIIRDNGQLGMGESGNWGISKPISQFTSNKPAKK